MVKRFLAAILFVLFVSFSAFGASVELDQNGNGKIDDGFFDAYGNLSTNSKIGTGSDQVSKGDHTHDSDTLTEGATNLFLTPTERSEITTGNITAQGTVYASSSTAITDFADSAQTGSLAAQIAVIDGANKDLVLPSRATEYPVRQALTISSNIAYKPQKGAVLDNALSVRSATYKWTASASGTAEYYLELAAGGDPGLNEVSLLFKSGSELTIGTAGSLAAGEWDWADNDSLGYSTIYYRDSGGGDPDSLDADSLQACWKITVNGPVVCGDWQCFDTLYGGVSGLHNPSAEMFGTNGVSDNTAINIAIASTGGQVRLMDDKRYHITGNINVITGRRLIGGKNTVLYVDADDVGISVNSYSTVADISLAPGTSTNYAAVKVLPSSGAWKLENIRILANSSYTFKYGIHVDASWLGDIKNPYVRGFSTAGIYLDDENTNAISIYTPDVASTAGETTADGIVILNGRVVSIIQPTVQSCHNGISITRTSSPTQYPITIVEPYFEANNANHIIMSNARQVSVYGGYYSTDTAANMLNISNSNFINIYGVLTDAIPIILDNSKVSFVNSVFRFQDLSLTSSSIGLTNVRNADDGKVYNAYNSAAIPLSVLHLGGALGNYADDATAKAAGLTAGDVYRNGDILMVAH